MKLAMPVTVKSLMKPCKTTQVFIRALARIALRHARHLQSIAKSVSLMASTANLLVYHTLAFLRSRFSINSQFTSSARAKSGDLGQTSN